MNNFLRNSHNLLGNAPALLYFSRSALWKSVTHLRAALASEKTLIVMPVKACPNRLLLHSAGSAIDGYEVSNSNELKLVPLRRRHLLAVHDPSGAFQPQHKGGGTALIYAEGAGSVKMPGTNALRLNTDFISGNNPSSRFGLDPAAALRLLRKDRGRWQALHFHHGWENNKLADFKKMARLAISLQKAAGGNIRWASFGGGLAKLGKGQIPMLGAMAEYLADNGFQGLILEPGRLLTESAGYAAARVNAIFPWQGTVAVTVSLSFPAHLRWSFPRILGKIGKAGLKKVHFFGASCAEGDRLSCFLDNASLENIKKRGIVHFENVSGYSLAWNTGFNGIPPARIVVD